MSIGIQLHERTEVFMRFVKSIIQIPEMQSKFCCLTIFIGLTSIVGIIYAGIAQDKVFVRSVDCANPEKTVECTELGKLQLGCCSTLWEDATAYDCSVSDSKTKCIGKGARECVPVTGYTKSHIKAEFSEGDEEQNVIGVKNIVDFETPVEECRTVDYEPPELAYMSLSKRRTLTLLPKYLLGKRCSVTLYKYHKIRQMWEHYFACPFDSFDIHSEDSPFFPLYKLAALSYYYPKIFELVCLASGEILECKKKKQGLTGDPDIGYCDCFQSSISANNFLFNQTSHGGKICGQREGYPCTHNITIKALTNNGCQVKAPVGQIRPEILNCEPDAGCSNLLEKNHLCPVNKICKCQCAEGHKCNGISNAPASITFSCTNCFRLLSLHCNRMWGYLGLVAVSFLANY